MESINNYEDCNPFFYGGIVTNDFVIEIQKRRAKLNFSLQTALNELKIKDIID